MRSRPAAAPPSALAAWLVTGPLGHLYSAVADLAVFGVRSLRGRLRRLGSADGLARRRPRPAGRLTRTAARAKPDGVHAGLPHHPRVPRGGLPGHHADRQLARAAPRRRDRADAGAAVVEGHGRAVRGRRGHRHRALVRDGPAVAGADGPLRRGVRRALRDRGDLLLHRGDLHRDLHLRLARPEPVGALLVRRADRDRGARRRAVGGGRQRVDEPAPGLHAGRRGPRHGRGRAGGDVQSARPPTRCRT